MIEIFMMLQWLPRRQCGFAALALLSALAGCAGDQALRESNALARRGDMREAVDRLVQARRDEPDDVQLRMALHARRDEVVATLLRQADQALARGSDDGDEMARQQLRTVLQYEPGHLRARQMLMRLDRQARHRATLAQAHALAERDPAEALARVRRILEEAPTDADALALQDTLMRRIAEQETWLPALDDAMRRPISLNFQSHRLMGIFDAIAKLAGVNFVFDSEVPKDMTASIAAPQTTAQDAIDLLLVTHQLRRKVLNGNTLLIYPARPSKEKEYRDVALKTFFLSHAGAKEVGAALKSMIKTRDIFVDERINAVVVRDAPEVVALADRLVQALDRPEAEVTLDVQVLEISATGRKKIGIDYPQAVGMGIGNARTDAAGGRVPLGLLGHLTRDDILVNLGHNAGVSLNLLQQSGDAQLLTNPKIRVKSGKPANIDIGEKIPVITNIALESGHTEEKVEFQEVGLNVKMTPRVSPSGEITVEVDLSVSSLGEPEKSPKGAVYYRSRSRKASTTLTARDNETQVLAGLINRSESHSTSGLPGLSGLPWLGRLFGAGDTKRDATEIVLVITPRIERNLDLPGAHVSAFISGTEARVGSRPLRLHATRAARVNTEADDTPNVGAENEARHDEDTTERPSRPARVGSGA